MSSPTGVRVPTRPQALTSRQALTALKAAVPAILLTVLCIVPFYAAPPDIAVYVLACLLLVLTGLPFARAVVRGSLDIFEPVQVISAIVALNFAIRSFYVMYEPTALLQIGAYPYDDYIAQAVVLMIGGYVALLCGYYLLPRSKLIGSRHEPRHLWPHSRLDHRKLVLLWIIGTVATGFRIASGEIVGRDLADDQITSSTFLLATASQCVQYAACIAALYSYKGTRAHWLRAFLWFVIVPTSFVQTLLFGSKTSVLMTLFVIAAARHYAGRRLRTAAIAAGIAVSVLVVFPVVNAYRANVSTVVGGRPRDAAELADSIGGIVSYLRQLGMGGYLQLSVENVMARSNGIDALSLIMKYTASELRHGRDYLLIPAYAFVPRLFWSTKPMESLGVRFGRRFFVASDAASQSYTSFGMFHIGDLYLNFRTIGTVAGMLGLGILYRGIYRYCHPQRQTDLGVIFVYIFLLWTIANGFESDIPTVYGNVLKSLVIWLIVKRWFDTSRSTVSVIRSVPVAQ